MSDNKYVSCPSCDNTILTAAYRDRFGRCKACYRRDRENLESRLYHNL